MKSINVCVIAIDVIKIARVKGEVKDSRNVEKLIVIIATKFIWIPGVRPVKVPASNPKIIAIENSINIFVYCHLL